MISNFYKLYNIQDIYYDIILFSLGFIMLALYYAIYIINIL